MRIDAVDVRLHWRLAPELLFAPERLNFVGLSQRRKAVRELYVYNLSEPIDACSVICPEEYAWLHVVDLRSVGSYEQACTRITVEVDTALLVPGYTHIGWLEVHINEFCRPFQVVVEMGGVQTALPAYWRLAHTLLASLLTLFFVNDFLAWHWVTNKAATTQLVEDQVDVFTRQTTITHNK